MALLRLLFLIVLTLLVIRLAWRAVRALRASLPQAGPPRQAPRPLERREPHEVLGVEPGADPSEIRRAYQRLVQQYHPDRLDKMAPELRELAERRTKELNAAYERLQRGQRS